MDIGFWNIQRASSWGTSDAAARYGLMAAWVDEMATRFDLIVLAEVTQNGPALVKELKSTNMWCQFVPVANKKGGVSPCSFMVLSKGVKVEAMAVGDGKRPLIFIDTGDILVGACHTIATQGEPSKEEILDMLAHLGGVASKGKRRGAILLGDMNYAIDKWGSYDLAYAKDWIIRAPCKASNAAQALSKTHRLGRVIDYAWLAGIDGCARAASATHDWTDWDVIDHTPIGFRVA
ncbi:endonuclease/exonuclease/phosphatase family protein [Azospirillum endophyticum]